MFQMDPRPDEIALQYQHWSCCQLCGRIIKRGSDPDWIDSPWKRDRRYRVVRCPLHWSEWALRNSDFGRTNANREKLYLLRRQYSHWPQTVPIPPYPIHDEPHEFTPTYTQE